MRGGGGAMRLGEPGRDRFGVLVERFARLLREWSEGAHEAGAARVEIAGGGVVAFGDARGGRLGLRLQRDGRRGRGLGEAGEQGVGVLADGLRRALRAALEGVDEGG